MLDKERIKEAEQNVKSYLSEGLLKKSAPIEGVLKILRKNAQESLEAAGHLSSNKISDLWVIVASYYCMYYIANAVLLKIGYKVGEKIVHKVTADSLIAFVRNKLKETLIEQYEEAKEEALAIAGMKADELIKSFDYERIKRSVIQYKTKEIEKHSKANTSLKRAKEFYTEMEKLFEDSSSTDK